MSSLQGAGGPGSPLLCMVSHLEAGAYIVPDPVALHREQCLVQARSFACKSNLTSLFGAVKHMRRQRSGPRTQFRGEL